jgi:hypothetical protein
VADGHGEEVIAGPRRKYFDLIGRVLRFALVVGVIAALLFVVERLVLR